jgi:amidase
VSDEILGALETLASALRRSGAHVGVARPESLGDLREYYRRYLVLIGATLSTAWTIERIEEFATRAAASTDEFGPGIFGGMRASARDYLSWLDERERHRMSYRAFFADWDVLLSPMSPVTAFAHDDRPIGERTLTVNGAPVPYGRLSVYPSIATLCGQPATVFPVARDGAGLPIAAQAIGPYLEDRTTIRFASCVATEVGGYVPPRGYDET